MYTLSQLIRGLRSPNLFARELNRLYHQRLKLRNYNTQGVDIVAEEWDNLILLDACRYDMFKENSNLSGKLQRKRSRGSTTVEFLKGNFADRDLLDTVYVTANPQLYRHSDDINAEFHDVINVWMEEGWDDEFGTVRPETMTEAALQVVEEYPNKRIIIHYIQPHYPFLTEQTEFDKGYLEQEEVGEGDFWYRRLIGELDISRDEVWDLYTENLHQVLQSVQSLLSELNGRSIVTADHGNMVGERADPLPVREWGHPYGIYTDELVEIPWLVVENGPRRDHIAEEPSHIDEDVSEEVVSERLESLGYVE